MEQTTVAAADLGSSLGYHAKALDAISKVEVPAGYRLARVIRKASAKGSSGLASQGAHVPSAVDTAEWLANDVIVEAVTGQIQKWQDACVRAVTDSGRNIVTADDIGVDAVVAWLSANDDTVGRLSADKIDIWFSADVEPVLVVALAEKLGLGETPTAEEVARVDKAVAGYSRMFRSLAGRGVSVTPVVATNLRKALDMVDTSGLSLRISAALDVASRQAEVDMTAL